MTNGKLFKVMEILKKYVQEDEHDFQSSHDVLHLGVDTGKISAEDLDALHKLGCVQDEYDSRFLQAYVSC